MDKGYIIAVVYDKKKYIIGYVVMYFVNNKPVHKTFEKSQLINAVKNGVVSIANAKLINNGFSGTLYALTDLSRLILNNGKFSIAYSSPILAVVHIKSNNNVILAAVEKQGRIYDMGFRTVNYNVLSKVPLVNRDKDTGKIQMNTIGNEPKVQPVLKPQQQVVQTAVNVAPVVRETPVPTPTPVQIPTPAPTQTPAKTKEELETEEIRRIEEMMMLNEQREAQEAAEREALEAKRKQEEFERTRPIKLQEITRKMEDIYHTWTLEDFKEYMELNNFEYTITPEKKIGTRQISKRKSETYTYYVYSLDSIDEKCTKYRTIQAEDFTQANIFKQGLVDVKWLMIDGKTMAKVLNEKLDTYDLNLDKLIFIKNAASQDFSNLSKLLPKASTRHNISEVHLYFNENNGSPSYRTNWSSIVLLDKANIDTLKLIDSRYVACIIGGEELKVNNIDISNCNELAISNAFKNSEILADSDVWDIPDNLTYITCSFTNSRVPRVLNWHSNLIHIEISFMYTNVEELNLICDSTRGSDINAKCDYQSELSGFDKTPIRSIHIPNNTLVPKYSGGEHKFALSGFNECINLETFEMDDIDSVAFKINNDFLCSTPALKKFIFSKDTFIMQKGIHYSKPFDVLRDSPAHIVFKEKTRWVPTLIEVAQDAASCEIEDSAIKLDREVSYRNYNGVLLRQLSEYKPDIVNRLTNFGSFELALQNEFDSRITDNNIAIASDAFILYEKEANSDDRSMYTRAKEKADVQLFSFTSIILDENVKAAFNYSSEKKEYCIAKRAIQGLDKLRLLAINSPAITTIEADAVYNCQSLYYLIIGPYIKNIAGTAFNNCKNTNKITVYIIKNPVADAYFKKRSDRFNIVDVESMSEAEELINSNKADPRQIAKYKMMLMNSEFGDVLQRTNENIWTQTRQIYNNFFTSSCLNTVNTAPDESKWEAIRVLDSRDELLEVIKRFRMYSFSSINGGIDNSFSKERTRFDALCKLITLNSKMAPIADNEYLLDLLSGRYYTIDELKYKSDDFCKFRVKGVDRAGYLILNDPIALNDNCYMSKTFNMTRESSILRCYGEVMYCMAHENSAIFKLTVKRNVDYEDSNITRQLKFSTNTEPTFIIIISNGTIVYATMASTSAIDYIFGDQLMALTFPATEKATDRMLSQNELTYKNNNHNLMQPGFSLFDSLSPGDAVSIRASASARSPEFNVTINSYNLQDFSTQYTLKLMCLAVLANTIIIGCDPENNPLDTDTNGKVQSSIYTILLYDLVTHLVIVGKQKRMVSKRSIKSLGIGDFRLEEKLTLSEAYEKYRDCFKYYDKMFVKECMSPDDLARVQNLDVIKLAIQRVVSGKTSEDIENIEVEDDSAYDINNSELLVIGKKLADLGYDGYNMTFEMLYEALQSPMYKLKMTEVRKDGISDIYVNKMVLYGEIENTDYEFVEYSISNGYAIYIVDVKTDIVKLLYTGSVEVEEFMRTLYNGYVNVRENRRVLENANKVTDEPVYRNDFLILSKTELRANWRDEKYSVMYRAIDKRNLDYYVLASDESQSRFMAVLRFNKYDNISKPGINAFYSYLSTLVNPSEDGARRRRFKHSIYDINYICPLDEIRHLIMSGYTDTSDVILASDKKETLKYCAKQRKIKYD